VAESDSSLANAETIDAGLAAISAAESSGGLRDSARRRVALVEGSAPQMNSETRCLLRTRLRTVAVLLFIGFAAFLGHCFPVWLGFKGGKGVATFLGTVLALSFPVGLAACATWLAIAFAFRWSSLAALIAAASAPEWAWLMGRPQMIALLAALALLVIWRHAPNIRRLLDGTEPKIGRKSE